MAASVCRPVAPNLARIIDDGEPACVTVTHCLNNSREAHAFVVEGRGRPGQPTASGAQPEFDSDDDVLRMPFFLVPEAVAYALEPFLVHFDGASVPKLLEELIHAGRMEEEDEEIAREGILTCLNLGLLTRSPPPWARAVSSL
jgi:hypothetical protein